MYLICDIDGTLSRMPLEREIAAATDNWEAYYRCDFTGDQPITQVLSIVEAWLFAGGIAVFVTSRRSTVRVATEDWLRRHLPSMNDRNSDLVMREPEDATPEHQWKIGRIMEYCPKASAALVIDDNHSICRALADEGYQVLEVVCGS